MDSGICERLSYRPIFRDIAQAALPGDTPRAGAPGRNQQTILISGSQHNVARATGDSLQHHYPHKAESQGPYQKAASA